MSTEAQPEFIYKNNKINIRLTYSQQMGTLPDKFDIRLLKLFVDNDEAMKVMQTLS